MRLETLRPNHFVLIVIARSFSAATRLFQIILDVARPSFSAEGRQWRTSVMQIFLHFFSCIWSSDSVSLGRSGFALVKPCMLFRREFAKPLTLGRKHFKEFISKQWLNVLASS